MQIYLKKTIENIIGCASTGASKELLLLPNGDCVEGYPRPVQVSVCSGGRGWCLLDSTNT